MWLRKGAKRHSALPTLNFGRCDLVKGRTRGPRPLLAIGVDPGLENDATDAEAICEAVRIVALGVAQLRKVRTIRRWRAYLLDALVDTRQTPACRPNFYGIQQRAMIVC